MTGVRTRPAPRGFTLIELLVVVAIIVALLALGLAAGTTALTAAKRSSTERLLQSIQQGIEQFRADHGYLPPLLNPDALGSELGVLVSEAQPSAFSGTSQDPLKQVNYWSGVSLSAYLLGVGDINGDEKLEYNAASNEVNLDDGFNGPGLRSPGPDKSWGGALKRPQAVPVNPTEPPIPPQEGRVFGPYINFANVSKALHQVKEEEEPADRLHRMKDTYQMLDRWGGVIRYYRHLPTGPRKTPTLDNMPAELLSPEAAQEYVGSTVDVLPTIDMSLVDQRTEYVLLSPGPDGLYGDRETESANIDPQDPKYLTAGGATGIGRNGTLSNDAKKRVLRRIADNMRLLP